ncbi:MAG: hypothetical protein QM766_13740 [Burkholderiaceae bacterium]
MLIASYVVVTTVIGGIRHYSPVPFWDFWGVFPFYEAVKAGDLGVWWAAHNEHRPVLARLLVYADFKLFDGALWPLIVVNYLLALCGFLLLYAWLRLAQPSLRGTALVVGACVLAVLAFSWSQYENLNWAFQGQFFLAQLLPMLSLYAFHRSLSQTGHAQRWFGLSVGAAILAIGALASGVLALPFLAIASLLTRQPARRTLGLWVLAAIGAWLYFWDAPSNPQHGTLGQALREQPADLLRFILLYLSGPFGSAFGVWMPGVAMTASAVMLMCCAVLAWRSWRQPAAYAHLVPLLAFLGFIVASAIGTGGGRTKLGVVTALSSRYMTPAYLGWAVFFVLCVSLASRLASRRLLLAAGVFVCLMVLPLQRAALQADYDQTFEQLVAALALKWRILDAPQLGHLFPEPAAEHLMAMSKPAVAQSLSVFDSRLPGPVAVVPRPAAPGSPDKDCDIRIELVSRIATDARFVRIRGQIAIDHRPHRFAALTVTDANGERIGAAIIHRRRIRGNAAFAGYMRADRLLEPATLSPDNRACASTVRLAPPN